MKKTLLPLLIFTILLITIFFLSTPENSLVSENQTVCSTPECFESTVKILQRIDVGVDPCENFYNFACGRYINNTIVPKSKASVSFSSEIRDVVDQRLKIFLEKPIERNNSKSSILIKSFYQACMNTAEMEANSLANMKKIFKNLGGWPVIEGDNWNENVSSWTDTMYGLTKLGLSPSMFFKFGLTPGGKNLPRLLLLDQPHNILDKELRDGLTNKYVKAYLHYMVQVAVAFGADENKAFAEMEDVINLEINITKNALSTEAKKNLLEGDLIQIRKLESLYSYMPWLKYINLMLEPVANVTYDDFVVVTYPQYFTNLEPIIINVSQRTLLNFIYWKTVVPLITSLNDDVKKLQMKFHEVLIGVSEREARWQECIEELKLLFPEATGAVYIQNFFKKEAKKTAEKIVNDIKNEFLEVLSTVKWMDNITRQHALEKAKAIELHVAYPDELMDYKKVNEIYENLTVNPSNYLESILSVLRFYRREYVQTNRIIVNSEWRFYASSTDDFAFYMCAKNSIFFPAGMLQDIFFDPHRPQYMNYGAIGSMVGHEITHGFDNKGRLYGKNGSLINWWEPKTNDAFKEKAQCIIDQYSNISVPNLHINLNGKFSQNENIADNGGIKLAYLAYKRWIANHGQEQNLPGLPYTPEQMFWISFGNLWCEVETDKKFEITVSDREHLPNIYRINVPLMNSEYFSKDFNCPKGSPMNPEHKCTVW